MLKRDTPISSHQVLASDNASGVHPEVLAKISAANTGHALGYGADALSAQAELQFKEQFGQATQTLLMFNGTAANVLALHGAVRSHEAVLCSEHAHLLVDECGAPEHYLGCKLIAVPSVSGKLTVTKLEASMAAHPAIVHRVQPRVISLAQPTERGTLYTLEELRSLCTFAHERGQYVHLDGARIANAAAAMNVSFRELTTDVGIDLLSFGGTKNGLMMAEALVVLNPQLAQAYPWIRKQGMQLASKHRFLAAQYLAYFERELWRRNALHANAMAGYLAERLAKLEMIALCEPVQVNLVFARIPSAWVEPLQRKTPFLCVPSGATAEARFVTSFDTTREAIDDFIDLLAELNQRKGP